ncbi:hypothetical protein [Larkinella sp.]|uniref:hypothetical protein n=1 Tax=Larkinella sp. TaxID=2034517 RepID=UPI003BA9DD33
MKNSTRSFFYITMAFCITVILPSKSQSLNSFPSQITISDTILLNTIKKYQKFVSNQESFIVGIERKSDTTKYYISAIRSLYKLSQNLPSYYASVNNGFILLYSGLESIVLVNTENKKEFLKKFNKTLENDILPDGSQSSISKNALYDPFQIQLLTINGKRISEDYKTGFGANGFPYFTK